MEEPIISLVRHLDQSISQVKKEHSWRERAEDEKVQWIVRAQKKSEKKEMEGGRKLEQLTRKRSSILCLSWISQDWGNISDPMISTSTSEIKPWFPLVFRQWNFLFLLAGID